MGKLVLDIQEYFLFSFVAGMTKMISKSTKDCSFIGNLYIDQLYYGLTHNPYLIVLNMYLEKGGKNNLLYFLLQQYLLVQNITAFYSFDYMNELHFDPSHYYY